MKITEEEIAAFFIFAKNSNLIDPRIIINPDEISCCGYLFGGCVNGVFTIGRGKTVMEAIDSLVVAIEATTVDKNCRRDQLLAELKALDEGN